MESNIFQISESLTILVDSRRVAKKPHFLPNLLLRTAFLLISIRMAKNEVCNKKDKFSD